MCLQIPLGKVKTLHIKKHKTFFYHENITFVVTAPVRQIAVHKKCQAKSIKTAALVAYWPSMASGNYPSLPATTKNSRHYSELAG